MIAQQTSAESWFGKRVAMSSCLLKEAVQMVIEGQKVFFHPNFLDVHVTVGLLWPCSDNGCSQKSTKCSGYLACVGLLILLLLVF